MIFWVVHRSSAPWSKTAAQLWDGLFTFDLESRFFAWLVFLSSEKCALWMGLGSLGMKLPFSDYR